MRRTFLTVLCLGLLAGLMGLPGPAAAKRVALVIGNDAYAEVPKLEKAVNDAIIATEEELQRRQEALKPKIPIVEIKDSSTQMTEESSEVVEFKSEDFEV